MWITSIRRTQWYICVIPTSRDNLIIFSLYNIKYSGEGGALIQLVEALPYKPEGSGFDSPCCHWNFSLTSFRPHYGPEVDLASNRSEYQEYFLRYKGGRCLGLTTFPLSGAKCGRLNLLKPSGNVQGLLYLFDIILSQRLTNAILNISA